MSEPEEQLKNEKTARPYQLRLLDYAIKQNSIIYLPTGSGKTYIAVLLIRHFSKDMRAPISEGGKRCFFLCNTVELARQNAKELASATNLKVALFIGEMDVDRWTPERWDKELSQHQIFVGTSQVFVDIVSRNFVAITDLSCVVLDECHNATKSHPMFQFLSLFMYADKSKLPRVVGLTGVLLNTSKKGNILSILYDLEATFRGRIVTAQNTDEYHNVLLYSTAPEEKLLTYGSETLCFDTEQVVKSFIYSCIMQLEKWDLGESAKYTKNLGALKEASKQKQIKAILNDFIYQMEDMGLYAASLAILGVIIQFEINKRNSETLWFRNLYRYLLTKCECIRHIIVKKIRSLSSDEDDDFDEADIILNFSTPKLQAFLSYLSREFTPKKANEISCLVFVQRRLTAKCLFNVIQNFVSSQKNLSHIIPDFIVGRNAGMVYSLDTILQSKWNRQVVYRFHRKECNLVVCSSVLEEGIDVQACNYVLSFDPIKHFASYVQMKGRARSRESTFAIVCPKASKDIIAKQIHDYKMTEIGLKKFLMTRAIDIDLPDEKQVQEKFKRKIQPLFLPSGAILTAEASLNLLHRYCQMLPCDSFTQCAVVWTVHANDKDEVRVSLELPIQSTIKDTIMSDSMESCKLAKMSAAFKACVKLYENGELSENLLPITKKNVLENVSENYFAKWKNEENDDPKEAGTKKKKRVYMKMYPIELMAAHPNPGDIAYVYGIKIEPEFKLDEQNKHIMDLLKTNSNFGIVLRHKLPALATMPLFMTQGPIKAVISRTPFEIVISDESELMKLKMFNKMLFSDVRSLWKKFLAVDSNNGPNSILIAPTKHDNAIDWEIVHQFQELSTVRFTTEIERKRKVFDSKDFLGKVVTTWYSMDDTIRYVVTKIHSNLTPHSAFPTGEFKSFAEYVQCKYNQNVVNDNQFLIEVQPLTSRTNFFVNPVEKKSTKERNRIILIPEMCHNFLFPGDLWLKSIFLPSILHRFHSLLNAEFLRKDINNFLGIASPENYEPTPIQIDYSLRRVCNENKPIGHSGMLPALETTRRDDTKDTRYTLVDVDEGNWKLYYEPVDFNRHTSSIYPIEVDYYYQFVNNLLDGMKSLQLEDVTDQQVTQTKLEAYKPQVQQCLKANSNKEIAGVSSNLGRSIKILDLFGCKAVRTAEQFEFLAAITTASVNDVFDMERYEVLGDSFLKFSASLLLMNRHTSWNEGYLTAVKSQMVSNRNLLYCMRAKFSASFICTSMFNPINEWLPPSATVPIALQNAIESNELSASCLNKLELSQSEIKSGVCSDITMQAVYSNNKDLMSNSSPDCLNEFLYKQSVSDKVVADSLEALLGVCVKNYGVEKSFEMLDYFGIYNDPQKELLPKLLRIEFGTPLVRANVKQTEIDAYLLNYECLEANLNYKFKNRAYLLQAVTHPSYPTNRLTGCYQQLEFIGDAILDFLISCYIFERCTHMNPGDITDLRSALVNNVTLACVCVRNNFHKYMLYESLTLSESIKRFYQFQETQGHRVTEQVNILLEETVSVDALNMAQNVDVPKALGDVIEAIIGAVFLDSGNDLRCTWGVISYLMDNELNEFIAEVPIEPVRQLSEYRGAQPQFKLGCVETDVVMMECTFYCRDMIKTVIGCGANKKVAKKAAAKMALQILYAN